MATGTMYHTHHRTAPQRAQAAALPCASGYHRGTHTDRTGHALRLYHVGTPHSGHTEPHSEPQPLQMACAAALPCRNTHTGRTDPHSGHTGAHSEPQHILPAQSTTPTIGQPQRLQIHSPTYGMCCGSTDSPDRSTAAQAAALPCRKCKKILQKAKKIQYTKYIERNFCTIESINVFYK